MNSKHSIRVAGFLIILSLIFDPALVRGAGSPSPILFAQSGAACMRENALQPAQLFARLLRKDWPSLRRWRRIAAETALAVNSSVPGRVERRTSPFQTGAFGNPFRALKMPQTFPRQRIAGFRKMMAQDRLYYDVNRATALAFRQGKGNTKVFLAPGLTDNEIQTFPDARYVTGRIAKDGPFFLRRQNDVLRGFVIEPDGRVTDFAGPMESTEKVLIISAFRQAVAALDYDVRVLLARKSGIRFELRADHDFYGEMDLDIATIILHRRLLENPTALLAVMIDEVRHLITGQEDEQNTAPALQAFMEVESVGYKGFNAALEFFETVPFVKLLFQGLWRDYLKVSKGETTRPAHRSGPAWDAYKRIFEWLAFVILDIRGPAVVDGRRRKTSPQRVRKYA